mgnify:CR=1 FL=1
MAVLFHIIFPDCLVDNMYLALAGVAVLPWLPRFLSSLHWEERKIEFQKIQEKVSNL